MGDIGDMGSNVQQQGVEKEVKTGQKFALDYAVKLSYQLSYQLSARELPD